jgi:exopolysaccharide production protein ExoQ
MWVLTLSNSATSTVCLGLGSSVLLLAQKTKVVQRRPGLIMLSIAVTLCAITVLTAVAEINFGASVAPLLGRDATLTGRTDIWRILVPMQPNAMLGAGYESFWIGDRLAAIWKSEVGSINEAHNGYLQVYLNIGLVGLLLLFGTLVATYGRIREQTRTSQEIGYLGMAIWCVLLVYNVTEAAFLGGLLWTSMLMTTVPLKRSQHVYDRIALRPRRVVTGITSGEPIAQPRPSVVHPRLATQPPIRPHVRRRTRPAVNRLRNV